MAYSRNGGRTAPQNVREEQSEKNRPVFTRKLWTPGGTLELAIFEKEIQGENKNHTNFFVVLSRSYFDPQKKDYVTTGVLNPQDLLMAGDLLKIAWEFILEECNRQ